MPATLNRPAASKYGDLAGGVTTFFTMAYIVVVNPGILSAPGTGMPFSGALTAELLKRAGQRAS